MKFIKKYSLLLLSVTVFGQSSKTVSIVNNYNNWGWNNVLVAKNKFISVAVVPDAAGRVLEFNLGETSSLWVNPKLFGKSFLPNDKVKMQDWRNFGGYRLVPIPVDNCAINSKGEKTKRWPPPAIIGDSAYLSSVSNDSVGNQIINVTSGIQNLPVPVFDDSSKIFSDVQLIDEQLQYKRSLHIEEGKSLVYIKHTLVNKGSSTIERGLKITSQHPTRSKPELEDGKNFMVYIPINKEDILPNGKSFEITATAQSRWNFINKNRFPLDKNNPDHIRKYFNNGTNWKGEVIPGIFELNYDYNLMGGLHIISSKSWICFVDKIKNTAFVKIFEPYNKELNYEYGANAEVYNSGLETGYLETEVKTPIYKLDSGESFDYYEIQGAAKIASPRIIDVNKTGIITQKLYLDNSTKIISGSYGVFIEGNAILTFRDKLGKIIKEINLGKVNPLDPFTFNKWIKKPLKKGTISLYIRDNKNQIYLLDGV